MPGDVKTKKSTAKSFVFYLFIFAFLSIFCSLSVYAQGVRSLGDSLFSPSVGQKFYEIAYELADFEESDQQPTGRLTARIEQAMVFLAATRILDTRADYILPDMIRLASQSSDEDYSGFVHALLVNYVDESADLEVAELAIQYLINQLDSREQREQMLGALLQNLGGKNSGLDSELHTMLGLWAAEKADTEAAQVHFMQAVNADKYNRLAFSKFTELMDQPLEPAIELGHLRLALDKNPLDIEAAASFARSAERLGLYDTAAKAYEYCADLFRFLHPSVAVTADIYLPWMLSSYNTQRNQHKCLQIVKTVRDSGRFDLLAEAIAGRAAAKIGDDQQASRILTDAGEKAQAFLTGPQEPLARTNNYENVGAEQLAWFYCFAQPHADNAIDWANKAYSIDPNSSTSAALLAYALVMNEQNDWAKQLIETYKQTGKTNPIADLTLAQIQLQQQQRDSAVEVLKSVIAADPGSLVAERARHLLTVSGAEYVSPIDPDVVLMPLRNSFRETLVPEFIDPQEVISVQLNVRGSKFSYGSEFGGTVVITNNSYMPLVISEAGLLSGGIRIDANISGDISEEIPNLVSKQIRPSSPVEPGHSLLVPVRLVTGRLRRILFTYPQASLDIEFTVYLDPIATNQGKLPNRHHGIKPVKLTVTRPGIELTHRFLQNRFNSLTKGRQGQKIKAVGLFIGLLAEQNAMANRQPLYEFMYADWIPPLLKSAMLHGLADDDWVVKVYTMAGMISLPLDYEMINAVAENLNDTHWPIRMIALFLLAENQGDSFKKVLDHTARYDPSRPVHDMAIALGAEVPEPPPQQPTPADQEEAESVR